LSACPFVLASCGEDAVGPSEVQGEWRLVSLEPTGQATSIIPDPSRFTARFGANGRLSLRADCNACNGSYVLADGTLVSSPFACTRAACSTAPLDTQFVGILEGSSEARETATELVVSSDRGRLVFKR
jgi:heat shock protein HslJ